MDRDALYKAVMAGLRNDDGRARTSVSRVYSRLTYEELKPLLPAIHQAVVERSPSGIMFSDGVRLNGLKLMAKHRIREGLPLCISILDLQRWGKKARIKGCVEAISIYGAAAKPLLPQLRQLEKDLVAHKESKGFQAQIEQLRRITHKLDTVTDVPELRSLGHPPG